MIGLQRNEVPRDINLITEFISSQQTLGYSRIELRAQPTEPISQCDQKY